ncbi:hypothetical protein [Amycolatopsis sp. NPDC051061]|uniref:hypothetical protein n=1 Tax=Amycolatopsis sp. NPDC051061 TaxID=3155042 RepID=UPI0034323229
MAELIEAVASWQTLLLVVGVFGFAPNFVLRLLVLVYPKDDPRRQELIAELKAMKWIERPLWVGEQFGTVLTDGLPHRISSSRQRRRDKKAQKSKSVTDRIYKVTDDGDVIEVLAEMRRPLISYTNESAS